MQGKSTGYSMPGESTFFMGIRDWRKKSTEHEGRHKFLAGLAQQMAGARRGHLATLSRRSASPFASQRSKK